MTTVWMTVTAALLMLYIHFKSKNILIYVCGILIERHCFKIFELLIRSISQYLAATFSYFKAMIDNMVLNSGPYFIWYAPLASSASSSVLPLYPSTHPYSSSSSRLLMLIVSWMSECLTLVFSSVYRLSNGRFMRCTFALFQRIGL